MLAPQAASLTAMASQKNIAHVPMATMHVEHCSQLVAVLGVPTRHRVCDKHDATNTT
jgi:hypothetical protein